MEMYRQYEADIDYEHSFARITTPLGLLTLQVVGSGLVCQLFHAIGIERKTEELLVSMTNEEAVGLVRILEDRQFLGNDLWNVFKKFQLNGCVLDKAQDALSIAVGTSLESKILEICDDLRGLELKLLRQIHVHLTSDAVSENDICSLIVTAFAHVRRLSMETEKVAS